MNLTSLSAGVSFFFLFLFRGANCVFAFLKYQNVAFFFFAVFSVKLCLDSPSPHCLVLSKESARATRYKICYMSSKRCPCRSAFSWLCQIAPVLPFTHETQLARLVSNFSLFPFYCKRFFFLFIVFEFEYNIRLVRTNLQKKKKRERNQATCIACFVISRFLPLGCVVRGRCSLSMRCCNLPSFFYF